MAEHHGWKFGEYQDNIYMASFWKKFKGKLVRLNIYLTTMTVATALDHPKKGKTQLYRHKVDWKLLNKIFSNPRAHTRAGYRTREHRRILEKCQ